MQITLANKTRNTMTVCILGVPPARGLEMETASVDVEYGPTEHNRKHYPCTDWE